MGIAILAVGVFGVLRVLPSSPWLVVALTWPVGLGMGVAGAIAPVAIKERFGPRSAVGTGAYTSGIQTGAFISAVTAVPLAQLVGGWRFSLGVFSAVSILLAVIWFLLVPEVPAREERVRPPALPWRSETAWLLVAMFSFMALTYYGVNAWLPDLYVERGWQESSAGALLAVANAMAIPASFVLPWLMLRVGRRQPVLLGASGVFLAAVVLLLTVPAGAWAWAVVFGTAQGGMFALSLTLPLDFESSPERVGALVAMQLGLGYTVGAVAPFALGGLRDVTGSYDAVLWTVAAFAGLLIACILLLPAVRRRSELSARAAI
jgi:CP family cyanate transporter-like MFS transporter